MLLVRVAWVAVDESNSVCRELGGDIVTQARPQQWWMELYKRRLGPVTDNTTLANLGEK